MGVLPVYTDPRYPSDEGRVQAGKSSRAVAFLKAAFIALLGFYSLSTVFDRFLPRASDSIVTPDFSHLSSICASQKPISLSEFVARRNGLISILQRTSFGSSSSVDSAQKNYRLPVYVTEPSPNTLYYFNITSSSWFLSERPFLSLVLPSFEDESKSQLVVLSPAFEESRARRLPWAVGEGESITFVPWKDEELSFDVLIDWLVSTAKKHSRNKDIEIVLQPDENVRNFVVNGLEQAASKSSGQEDDLSIAVRFVAQEVREQRMRKSPAELELLRCAERATRAAVQEVRKLLRVGMIELEAEALIISALRAAGFPEQDTIVLFGENAALPHASAGTKRLEEGEFVLFDVGGPLHGYYSDLTRTVLPPSVPVGKWPSPEHEKVWKLVQKAQQKAVDALETKGVKAADVDGAAREVIEDKGLGHYFTHRVGHGIGLEVHEAPYLTAANKDLRLLPGETFSDEPGIYIEGSIGVRLEDTILKTKDGYEILSGGFTTSPWEP
ncbi:Creatinase/aminopeptidase [Atractiella rhizophila]|nr:Creatinase/aminopeptidase [Atractiella rhizophila]